MDKNVVESDGRYGVSGRSDNLPIVNNHAQPPYETLRSVPVIKP